MRVLECEGQHLCGAEADGWRARRRACARRSRNAELFSAHAALTPASCQTCLVRLSHSHTFTPAPSHTLTLSPSHTLTLTLSHPHTLILSHPHTLTRSKRAEVEECGAVQRPRCIDPRFLPESRCQTLTPSHLHTRTLSHHHTRTHSHPHTITQSHPHTHSHTLTPSKRAEVEESAAVESPRCINH